MTKRLKHERIEVSLNGFYIHAEGDAVQPALEAVGQLLAGLGELPGKIAAPQPAGPEPKKLTRRRRGAEQQADQRRPEKRNP